MRNGMTTEQTHRSRSLQIHASVFFRRALRPVYVFLFTLALLFADKDTLAAEAIHCESFAGTVTSRTNNEVYLRIQRGVELGRNEKVWVYQKRDVIEIGGVVVKVNWARIGKLQINSFTKGSAKAVVLEENPDFIISVGDEVGKLPNTPPKIISIVADSTKVRPGHEISIYVEMQDDEGDTLRYSAQASGGNLLPLSEASPLMQWVAPQRPGNYEITVDVSDGKGGNTTGRVPVEVLPVSYTDPYNLVATIGGSSKAFWQFGEVTDIGIDNRDNIWVLDRRKKLLRKITPAGSRQAYIDLEQKGMGFGVSLTKIHLGDESSVYLLDTPHKTLYRLHKESDLVDHIFQADNYKSFLFETPSDVELTRSGDLLVCDSTGGHVVTINKDGQFVLLFAAQGTDKGQLMSPVSIATTKSGDIYVLDSGKREILEFDSSFRFLASYPCTMQGEAGKISTYARDGSLFMLDCGSSCVSRLDDSGKLIPHISSIKGKDSSGPSAKSMAIRSDGHILIGTENASIWEFDSTGKLCGTLGEEDFRKVPSIAATDDGTLFILDSSLAQVKKFDRHGWLRVRFGEKGEYEGQFKKPTLICADSEGNCYVFDQGMGRIQRFTSSGVFDKLITAGDDMAADFKDAADIAVARDGTINILDDRRKAILILSHNGEFQRTIPLTSSDARSRKEIKHPEHLAVDGEGTIYVSDPSQFVVYKFDREGKRIQTLGGKGKEPGQFGRIGDLVADRSGFVYVLLTDRDAIAKFDKNGKFLTEIALNLDKDQSLKKPEVVTVDAFGALYVYDGDLKAVFKYMQ